jgi:hypothetical protein
VLVSWLFAAHCDQGDGHCSDLGSASVLTLLQQVTPRESTIIEPTVSFSQLAMSPSYGLGCAVEEAPLKSS